MAVATHSSDHKCGFVGSNPTSAFAFFSSPSFSSILGLIVYHHNFITSIHKFSCPVTCFKSARNESHIALSAYFTLSHHHLCSFPDDECKKAKLDTNGYLRPKHPSNGHLEVCVFWDTLISSLRPPPLRPPCDLDTPLRKTPSLVTSPRDPTRPLCRGE